MKSTFSLQGGIAAMWLLAISSTINAHTWVENLRLIASNGTFVGEPGFIRSYGPRSAGVDPDAQNVYLLPPNGPSNEILPTDLMCKSNQQIGVQTPKYPTLQAAPGDHVALTYYENGHVTIPTTQVGKPAGRGTVFVYGTKNPSPTDTYLGIHRIWNAEGTVGNGKLLATQPYDDGRCFQAQGVGLAAGESAINLQRKEALNYPNSKELPCQTDIQIPADAGTDTYTLYWVWEWPTLFSNGAVQKNESYTSCMDITLTSNVVAPAGSFIAAQVSGTSALSAGISAAMATPFLVNPTALPQVAADNPNPTPVPAGVQAPTQAPAVAPAATSPAATSPAATSPAASSSAIANQGGKMVTVTVTEAAIQTVTVTKMVPTVSASPPPSTASTQSSIATPPSQPSSSAIIATGKPVVTPFLAPTKRAVAVRGRSVMI
jgi:hypothetical protein